MLLTLNQVATQADGRYLSDQEIKQLEVYIQSYDVRLKTYQLLSQNSASLIIASLKQLAKTHRQEVQAHSFKCKRDMEYALKEIAKAVLMDESELFKQSFALWLENITRAVHKSDSAARAYAHLKAEISRAMSPECAALVVPYIDDLILSFTATT
ncbi:MAG: hypothetical protein ACFBSG_14185 [Leptolyngbyaceae cyanobacterium]